MRPRVLVADSDAGAASALGEALAESGDVAAAVASYEKSLELNPDNENARAMLAELQGK